MKRMWFEVVAGLGNGIRYGIELGVKAALVTGVVTWGMIRVIEAAGRVLGKGG